MDTSVNLDFSPCLTCDLTSTSAYESLDYCRRNKETAFECHKYVNRSNHLSMPIDHDFEP